MLKIKSFSELRAELLNRPYDWGFKQDAIRIRSYFNFMSW